MYNEYVLKGENMKKYWFLIVFLLIVPCLVFAKQVENPDYKVIASYITADIDVVGSMHVKEAYIVKGSLNGYRRNIKFRNSTFPDWEAGKVDFQESSFYNARGISLSKISSKKIDESQIGWDVLSLDYDKFKEESNVRKGSEGVFSKIQGTDGYDVSIYNPCENGYIVYYFDYYVNQVVMLHNDTAELYYTFFKLDSDDVGSVNIQVTTPVLDTKDNYRFWAHAVGALNGTISGIIDKKNDKGEDLYRGVLLKMDNYKKGEIIDIRMLFDKKIYANLETVLNNSKMDAFDKVLEIEEQRAQEANNKRVVIKVLYYGTLGLGIVYLIGLVIIWVYIYRKYDREYEVGFKHKYYREFIEEYDVEVVDYLLNQSVSTNALNASIMNLIYKKNIEIEEIKEELNIDKKHKASNNNIVLKLKSRDNVSDAEEKILNLLFEKIGKDNKVSLKEIENYSSDYSTATDFMNAYNSWNMTVVANAKKENFFENYRSVRGIASMYFVLGLLIVGIITFLHISHLILSILIVTGGIAFLIYVLSFKKWTRRGREHYLKWMAFKNFLKDFSLLSEKDVPDIVLWDKYLVYATLLGIAKEVQKSMRVKLTDLGMEDAMVGTFYYRNYYMFDSLNHSMSKAHSKSVSTINAHNASSSMSSGSGFGGGFSSGGGHAGGGGGGGGF